MDRVAQARINGRKGGRPPRGEVKWRAAVPNAREPERQIDRWWACVVFRDDARRWVELDASIPHTPEGETRARELAVEAQRQIREGGLVLARETVNEWTERYLAWREAQGFVTVPETRGRLRNRVLDTIGMRDVRRVTRAQIEDVRDRLDREVREGRISWKTAFHTWSDLRCMLDEMVNSKDRTLRVRSDDPSTGVRAPDKGADKAKTILFPDEVAALVSCVAVPFAYRVLYAVAIYTGLRAGELEALTVHDVDLAHGFLHVDKAVSRKTGEVGPTKHEHVGQVPIEPELAVLLAELVRDREDDAPLVWLPVDEDRAPSLRRHLRAAGITRAAIELHDERNKRLVFHDLRATHLTWRACRGDQPSLIEAVARHESYETTRGYVHRATLLRGIGAAVFGPLPRTLAEGASGFASVLQKRKTGAPASLRKHPVSRWRPQWELNPCSRRERPVS